MTFTEIEPVRGEPAAILEAERQIEPQSADSRARAFARARGAILASPLRARSELPYGGFRWLVAAAIVAAAASAWAARIHAKRSVPRTFNSATLWAPSALSNTKLLTPTPGAVSPSPLDPAADAGTSTPPLTPSAVNARGPSARGLYALELKVLQRAQVAVAAANFAQALSAIAEHARRFPKGQLAEEREGLRVEALAGLHHTEEARRAAAAFSARFPGSVLLPGMTGAEKLSP